MRTLLGFVYLIALTVAFWFQELVPQLWQKPYIVTVYCMSLLMLGYVGFLYIKAEYHKFTAERHQKEHQEIESFLDTPQYAKVRVEGLREGKDWFIWVGMCPRDPFWFFAPKDLPASEQYLQYLTNARSAGLTKHFFFPFVLSPSGYEEILKSSPEDDPSAIVAFNFIYQKMAPVKKVDETERDHLLGPCPECGV